MKKLIVIVTLMWGYSVSAAQLAISCGENSYEALEQQNLDLAEFVLVLKTRGPNNPPELVSLNDEGVSLINQVSGIIYNFPNITVEMKNYDRYEITNLTGCDDIDSATGDIAFFKYVGGFAGHSTPIRAKCSCLK